MAHRYPLSMNKRVFAALAAVLIVAAALYMLHPPARGGVKLRVFNAGSLTIPLSRVGEEYAARSGVAVELEPSGSVEAVRKVTDLGKRADVVAVADYRLIPMYMVPRYADWYVAFATNRIVIAYTPHSRYAKEMGEAKSLAEIMSILERPDVKYGFSDPNKDPCGYRSVGVIALSSLRLHDPQVLEKLLSSKVPGLRVEEEAGRLHVYVPAVLEARGNLVVRPKEVDLVALLESGSIDYAFEYLSVAVQHNLSYVLLPEEVSLSNPQLDGEYSRVVVHILTGTDSEKAIPMRSIVYGVTVPRNAPHSREAIEFVKFLLGGEGRRIFQSLGQPFLPRPLGYGNIPEELRSYVQAAGG